MHGRAGIVYLSEAQPESVIVERRLSQLRTVLLAGSKATVVRADAGHGTDTDFRDGIIEMGLPCVLGIRSSISLWPAGQEPLLPKQWSGHSRPPSAVRRDAQTGPSRPNKLRWTFPRGRGGGSSGGKAATQRPEEWRLIEWLADEPEPTKYWLSTLAAIVSRRALVTAARLRWRIEGVSSATIRTSSKSSALATTREAVGVASIITTHYASPRADP